MPLNKLKAFLDDRDVRYISIRHSKAYTAQEIAESVHVPGKEVAKTVMIKINGQMAMAVLPATERVDFDLLKSVADTQNVQLAGEEEFQNLFPECEAGAMPPFGNIYGMAVYVEESLARDKEIFFNACSHTELLRMSYADYERLVHPRRARFSTAND
ncbi:MAG: YbaK/EbsC family protein [Deltaproteobacteria bacterium]|nr:YbaK/EbsC family protein [Deltaproteobacteria bacterium]